MRDKEHDAEYSRRRSRQWKIDGLCSHCGSEIEDSRFVRCLTCRTSNNTTKAAMKSKYMAADLCYRCGKNPVKDGFKTCEICNKRAYERAKRLPGAKEMQKAIYQRVKDQCFAAYGGYVCACCGETEPMFLCIDHINGGGTKHKLSLGNRSIHYWLRDNGFPSGFQILCQNCNIGKYRNNGICPHKKQSVTDT